MNDWFIAAYVTIGSGIALYIGQFLDRALP